MNVTNGAELDKQDEILALIVNSSNLGDPITKDIIQWSTSLGNFAILSIMNVIIQTTQYGIGMPKTKYPELLNVFFFFSLLLLTVASLVVSIMTAVTVFKVNMLYLHPDKDLARGLNDVIAQTLGNLSIASLVIGTIFTSLVILSHLILF